MASLRLSTLEILFLEPETPPGSSPDSRNLVKELRERYWTKAAEDAEHRPSWVQFGFRFPYPFERQDLGRDREQPGDGFRYVFSGGTTGTESRVEWFEVTEVYAAVDPRDVEAFMRVNNGLPGYPGFDAEPFLAGLDMGNPSRPAQRRAADQVIAAIDGKLRKSSYAGMTGPHGYGTLVVGLPLWFASPPADPLREANVLDDFNTRVAIRLRRYRHRLARTDFPFWRIVVVWHVSARSLRDSKARANMRAYRDPTYRPSRPTADQELPRLGPRRPHGRLGSTRPRRPSHDHAPRAGVSGEEQARRTTRRRRSAQGHVRGGRASEFPLRPRPHPMAPRPPPSPRGAHGASAFASAPRASRLFAITVVYGQPANAASPALAISTAPTPG